MGKYTRFTVKIIIPTLPEPTIKIIHNCTWYKDKLVTIAFRGVGEKIEKGGLNIEGEGDTWIDYASYQEYVKPLLSSYSLIKNGLLAQSKKDSAQNKWTNKMIDKYLECMFSIGDNEGGYIVINKDEEELRKVLSGTIPIEIIEGVFGFRINTKLPMDIWKNLKPFAKYRSGNDEDLEYLEDMGYFHLTKYDVNGWWYTEGAIGELLKLKTHTILYEKQKISTLEDLEIERQNIIERKKRHQSEVEKYKK